MNISELIKSYYPEKKILDKIEITDVCMDSRKIKRGSLFFAINSGNMYVSKALESGAALVFYDDASLELFNERAILVEDTVKMMQKLARDYRKATGIKVIAITGSNGKTTTKDIVYSILSQKYRTRKTEGNYNNHIGLPYTILQISHTDEVLILEMGMSNFGEIDLLCRIASPDYGIITNIGDSHLEFLKTRENVFKAKGELLNYIPSERMILFGDDRYLRDVEGVKVGSSQGDDYTIENLRENDLGTEFTLNREEYFISVNGIHNAINASFAVVIGKKLGLSTAEIQNGLRDLELTPMRFQRVEKGEKIYINDAYNASPISMRYALATFDKLYNEKTCKVAVLGDMLELGKNSGEYHENLKEILEDLRADYIFLYGSEMKKLWLVCRSDKRVLYFTDKNEIIKKIGRIDGKAAILLKGSRGMRLEEIIK